MCGRYAVTLDAHALAEELEAELASEQLPRSVNLAPSMPAPILVARGGRRLGPATFGLVLASRANERSPKRFVNARGETLAKTHAFRDAAARRRCLVPAEGFYEWKIVAGKKQPYYVRASDGSLLTFAGVYAIAKDAPPGPARTTFAIVTRPAIGVAGELHDRMPLIVPRALREAWLDADDPNVDALLEKILACPSVDLEAFPVSPLVNDPHHDDPSVRERITLDPER